MKVHAVARTTNAARRLLASQTLVTAMAVKVTSDMSGIEGVVMWASEGEYAGRRLVHGPRVKVSNIKNRFDPTNNFSLDFTGKLVAGRIELTPKEIHQCREWIAKNHDLLLSYWHEDVTAQAFYQHVKKVSD
jgi:hypothetical protein